MTVPWTLWVIQVLLGLSPGLGFIGNTWRFRGSYKWGYKSPSMGYKFSYPTCNATYNYP